jgi:hypothetical protein
MEEIMFRYTLSITCCCCCAEEEEDIVAGKYSKSILSGKVETKAI